MIDFGALPPEVNSLRMYTGPGAQPMLAAADAWEHAAMQLSHAAASYRLVVLELLAFGTWSGPSAAAMAAAAAHYADWLTGTAERAAQTGLQALGAAAAFEAARAATVPPPAVAANRATLAALVATNFLGVNTPAIAATEASYAEMWAQDAVAMYGYAWASAEASKLTPFHRAPSTTRPSGLAGHAVEAARTGYAVVRAALTPGHPHSAAALNPYGGFGDLSALRALIEVYEIGSRLESIYSWTNNTLRVINTLETAKDQIIDGTAALTIGEWFGPGPLQSIVGGLGGMTATNPGIAAGMGNAISIGGLSAPASWALPSPVAAAAPLAGGSAAAAPAAAAVPTALIPTMLPGSVGS